MAAQQMQLALYSPKRIQNMTKLSLPIQLFDSFTIVSMKETSCIAHSNVLSIALIFLEYFLPLRVVQVAALDFPQQSWYIHIQDQLVAGEG